METEPDPELGEVEKEVRWEGSERTKTNRRRTGSVNDGDNNYAPPHPELEAAAA